MGGKDVYLSSFEIGSFRVNDRVSFDVVLNRDGKPQARNLQHAGGPAPAVAHWVPPTPPPAIIPAYPVASQMDPAEDFARYSGTIISFMPDKHFGFIKCEETHAKHTK